jgi:hypothetical protein
LWLLKKSSATITMKSLWQRQCGVDGKVLGELEEMERALVGEGFFGRVGWYAKTNCGADGAVDGGKVVGGGEQF